MWFDVPPDQRIPQWRSWRESLSPDPIVALKEIASTWGRVPLKSYYLTPDSAEDWPSPWQLVHDNLYCDLSVSLGMFYSIVLSDTFEKDPVIAIYLDNSAWINVLYYDNKKYVLNWNHSGVVNTITERIEIAELTPKYQYTVSSLRHLYQ